MILCILEFTDRKILTLLMSDDVLNAEASEIVLNLQCTDCGGLLRSLFLPLPGETPCTLPCSHPAVLRSLRVIWLLTCTLVVNSGVSWAGLGCCPEGLKFLIGLQLNTWLGVAGVQKLTLRRGVVEQAEGSSLCLMINENFKIASSGESWQKRHVNPLFTLTQRNAGNKIYVVGRAGKFHVEANR